MSSVSTVQMSHSFNGCAIRIEQKTSNCTSYAQRRLGRSLNAHAIPLSKFRIRMVILCSFILAASLLLEYTKATAQVLNDSDYDEIDDINGMSDFETARKISKASYGTIPLGGLVKLTTRFAELHHLDTSLLGVLAMFGDQMPTYSPPLRESLVLAQPITACSPLFRAPMKDVKVLPPSQQDYEQKALHPLTFETLLKHFSPKARTKDVQSELMTSADVNLGGSAPKSFDPVGGRDLSDLLLSVPWSFDDSMTSSMKEEQTVDGGTFETNTMSTKGSLDRSFVVVFRGGGCSFAEKALNVQQSGAQGMILINERVPRLVSSILNPSIKAMRQQAKSKRLKRKRESSPQSGEFVDVDQPNETAEQHEKPIATPRIVTTQVNRDAVFAMGADADDAAKVKIPSILISAESGTKLLQVMAESLSQAAMTRSAVTAVHAGKVSLFDQLTLNSSQALSNAPLAVSIGDVILPPALGLVVAHAPAVEALLEYLWIQDVIVADAVRLSFSTAIVGNINTASTSITSTNLSSLHRRRAIAEQLLGEGKAGTSRKISAGNQLLMMQLRVSNMLETHAPDMFLEAYTPHVWDSSWLIILFIATITVILGSFYGTCPQKRRYKSEWVSAIRSMEDSVINADTFTSQVGQRQNMPILLPNSSSEISQNISEISVAISNHSRSSHPSGTLRPVTASQAAVSDSIPKWSELVAGWRVDLSQFFSTFGDSIPESLLSEHAQQTKRAAASVYAASRNLLSICNEVSSVEVDTSSTKIDMEAYQRNIGFTEDDVADVIVVALVQALERQYQAKQSKRDHHESPKLKSAPGPEINKNMTVLKFKEDEIDKSIDSRLNQAVNDVHHTAKAFANLVFSSKTLGRSHQVPETDLGTTTKSHEHIQTDFSPHSMKLFDVDMAAERARTAAQAIQLVATSSALEDARRTLSSHLSASQQAELRTVIQFGAVPVLPTVTSLGVLLPIGPGFRGRLVALSIRAAAAEIEMRAKASSAAIAARASAAAASATQAAALAHDFDVQVKKDEVNISMLKLNTLPSSTNGGQFPTPAAQGSFNVPSPTLQRQLSVNSLQESKIEEEPTTHDEDSYLLDDYDPTEKGQDLDGEERANSIQASNQRLIEDATIADEEDTLNEQMRTPILRKRLRKQRSTSRHEKKKDLQKLGELHSNVEDGEEGDVQEERENAVALRREQLRRSRSNRSILQSTNDDLEASKNIAGQGRPAMARESPSTLTQSHVDRHNSLKGKKANAQNVAAEAYSAYLRAASQATAAHKASLAAEKQAALARSLAASLLEAVRAATGRDPPLALLDAKAKERRRAIFGDKSSRKPMTVEALYQQTADLQAGHGISASAQSPASGDQRNVYSTTTESIGRFFFDLYNRFSVEAEPESPVERQPLLTLPSNVNAPTDYGAVSTNATHAASAPIGLVNEVQHSPSDSYITLARELGFLDADVDFEGLFESDDEPLENENTDSEDDDGHYSGPEDWSDGEDDDISDDDQENNYPIVSTNNALLTVASLLSGTYWQGTAHRRVTQPTSYWVEKDAKLVDAHDALLKDWQREEFGLDYEAPYVISQSSHQQQQQQLPTENFYLVQTGAKVSKIPSNSQSTTSVPRPSTQIVSKRTLFDATLERQKRLHNLLVGIGEIQEERKHVANQRLKAKMLRSYLDEKSNRTNTCEVTPLFALLLALLGSGLLILIYYVRFYVSQIIIAIFIVCSTLSLYAVSISATRQCSFDSLMHLRIPGRWISFPWLPSFNLCFSALVVAVWRTASAANHSSAWALQNFLIFVMLLQLMRVLKVRSLRAGVYLLLACLVYDVFWVYCSPHIFSKPLMVDVASKSIASPLSLSSAINAQFRGSNLPEVKEFDNSTVINASTNLGATSYLSQLDESGHTNSVRTAFIQDDSLPVSRQPSTVVPAKMQRPTLHLATKRGSKALRNSVTQSTVSTAAADMPQSGGIVSAAASAATGVIPEALPLTIQVPRSSIVGEELLPHARQTQFQKTVSSLRKAPGDASRSSSSLIVSSKTQSKTLPGSHSLLGIGDIALPGLFLVYLLRTDYELGMLWDAGLFVYGLVGYILGLAATTVTVALTQKGQPAMLFIAPLMLIPVFLLARSRGLLQLLWDGMQPQTRRALRARSIDMACQQTSLWKQLAKKD